MRQKPIADDNNRLDCEIWISTALEVLAREGIDAVRIELLARKLNVTKGSFYWHFKDRDALHAAMLGQWRRRVTLDVIDWLERTEDPFERFMQAMRLPLAGGPEMDVELAIRLWARRDERARAVLEEVDGLRLRYLSKVIAACGVPEQDAHARAVVALAYLCIAIPLVDSATREQCERLFIGI